MRPAGPGTCSGRYLLGQRPHLLDGQGYDLFLGTEGSFASVQGLCEIMRHHYLSNGSRVSLDGWSVA